MAETTTPTTTSEKSWWEKISDTLGNLGTAAGNAYDKYTQGQLNEAVADKVENTKPTNWYLVAGIAALGLALFGLVAWLLTRKP
jgi:hypothetical protein